MTLDALDIQNFVLRLAAGFMCSILVHSAHGTEVYKWTDVNGKVQFGDRKSAPVDGEKLDVKVQPANLPSPEQRDVPKTAQPRAPVPQPKVPVPEGLSKPADLSLVRAGCQDLIDQISKVKPGTKWESLYERFNATCPGIAYECNTYRTHPEDNKCAWVERTGGTVLRRNIHE